MLESKLEYKIVKVSALTHDTLMRKAEQNMNDMAKMGWKTVTTAFSAASVSCIMFITYAREQHPPLNDA